MKWLFFAMAFFSLVGVVIFHIFAPPAITLTICRPKPSMGERDCVYRGDELVYWSANSEHAKQLHYQMLEARAGK